MENDRPEDNSRSTVALSRSEIPSSVPQAHEDVVMVDTNRPRDREGTVESAIHRSCSPQDNASQLQTRPRTNTNLARSALANATSDSGLSAFDSNPAQTYLPSSGPATNDDLACCSFEPVTPCDPSPSANEPILDRLSFINSDSLVPSAVMPASADSMPPSPTNPVAFARLQTFSSAMIRKGRFSLRPPTKRLIRIH